MITFFLIKSKSTAVVAASSIHLRGYQDVDEANYALMDGAGLPTHPVARVRGKTEMAGPSPAITLFFLLSCDCQIAFAQLPDA
jgi:hypothetical protein